MTAIVGETAKVPEPITAGNNARIGPSAVPVDPVASDATVVGNLARPVDREIPSRAAAFDPYDMPRDDSLGRRLRGRSDSIAIADIVAAVDEPIQATHCPIGSGGCLAVPASPGEEASGSESRLAALGVNCQTYDLWFELGRQIALFLGGITLADIVLGRFAGRAVGLPPHPPSGDQPQAAG